jgi:hypothetical protein
MMMRISNLMQTLTSSMLSLAVLGILVTSAPVMAEEYGHSNHNAPAKLVQTVRDATRQFANNPDNAGPDYVPTFGCVSGPDHGAMGIHYVNFGLVGDGKVEATTPEALVYEPQGHNRFQLVAVEYIVDAPTWLADKDHNGLPPQLEGQAFQLIGTPNRFGIPSPFFELHVWLKDNPQGSFVDWNNNVSCDRQQ